MTDQHDGHPVDPDDGRDFAAVLLELQRGRTHEECSRGLRQVVAAVARTGKRGELLLRLRVSRPPNMSGDALLVADEVRLTVPEHDRPASLFWPTDGGDLVQHDPRQRTLDDFARETT